MSKSKTLKFYAVITDKKENIKKTVSFGQKGASDYTIHKDPERTQRYINRHKKNKQWSKSGIKMAGFWAKIMLWNKPTIKKTIDDLTDKLNNARLKVAGVAGV